MLTLTPNLYNCTFRGMYNECMVGDMVEYLLWYFVLCIAVVCRDVEVSGRQVKKLSSE